MMEITPRHIRDTMIVHPHANTQSSKCFCRCDCQETTQVLRTHFYALPRAVTSSQMYKFHALWHRQQQQQTTAQSRLTRTNPSRLLRVIQPANFVRYSRAHGVFQHTSFKHKLQPEASNRNKCHCQWGTTVWRPHLLDVKTGVV